MINWTPWEAFCWTLHLSEKVQRFQSLYFHHNFANLYRFFADSFNKGILFFDFYFLIWYRFRDRLIIEIERESGVPAARALQLNVGNLRTVRYIYLAVDWLTFDGLPVLGLV
jgi:hypothetical protein